MRPLTAVAIIFIAAVGIDLGLSRFSPGLWLPVAVCSVVGNLGEVASTFVVPALWIFPPVKTRALRSLALRAVLAVLVSWFLTILFHGHFSLPASRAMARQQNNYDYDGIGGNAAVLAGGWIFPLIITILMVGVERGRPNRKLSDSSAIRTEPEEIP